MHMLPRQLRPPFRTRAGRACGPRRTARRAGGFSLVEAMVSAGIVGVMLVASVNLLSSAARTRVADSNRRTALLLAQQLMSEVIAQPYKDENLLALLFGPELGENSRADFDDVDDYSNYQEKPLKDRGGAVIAGFEAWKRKVKVIYVSTGDLSQSATDTGLELVQVTAIDPRGVETSVYALRAERAVPADTPATGSTWAQWTDIDLQVGGNAPRRVVTAANNVSRPPAK
jgi:type II secretory pathway pseudopilin PulG